MFLSGFCSGDALSHLLASGFTEAAGSRKGFPKLLLIITDGKSDDPVEGAARQLRSRGVDVFVLGEPPDLLALEAANETRLHSGSPPTFHRLRLLPR